MVGYWPSSFFSFLWTETKLRSIKTQKKNEANIQQILTEQAWSIKYLLYGQKVTPSIFFNAPANVYLRNFQNQA